jgi:hypothetical protein
LTCDVLPHRLAARHDMRFSLDRRLVPAGHPGGKADTSSAELQLYAALLRLSNRDNHASVATRVRWFVRRDDVLLMPAGKHGINALHRHPRTDASAIVEASHIADRTAVCCPP